MTDINKGDVVEVWNPIPTGAKGEVLYCDGKHVAVQWTHGLSAGQRGRPLRSLLRVVPSERSRPAPTEGQKWTPGQWR